MVWAALICLHPSLAVSESTPGISIAEPVTGTDEPDPAQEKIAKLQGWYASSKTLGGDDETGSPEKT